MACTATSGTRALAKGKVRLITIEEIKARATQGLNTASKVFRIEQLLLVSLIEKYQSSLVVMLA